MENQVKKRRLPLSLKETLKEGNCRRFVSPTKLNALAKAAKGVVSVNTNWAMRAFLTLFEI